MSNSYGLIGDGANSLSNFNGTGHEEPARITNQTSSGYNEFAVPGNISSSSRNETSIRKKVSGHLYIICHSKQNKTTVLTKSCISSFPRKFKFDF